MLIIIRYLIKKRTHTHTCKQRTANFINSKERMFVFKHAYMCADKTKFSQDDVLKHCDMIVEKQQSKSVCLSLSLCMCVTGPF